MPDRTAQEVAASLAALSTQRRRPIDEIEIAFWRDAGEPARVRNDRLKSAGLVARKLPCHTISSI
jgi:hypothetical protein